MLQVVEKQIFVFQHEITLQARSRELRLQTQSALENAQEKRDISENPCSCAWDRQVPSLLLARSTREA